MKKEASKQKSLPFFGIGKVLPYLKKYKKPLFFMILGSLVGSLVDTGVPLFQRYALNHFIGEGTLDTIVWFVILYLTLIVGGAVFNYISARNSMCIEVGVDRDLRNRAFSHLQTLSFSYYNQNSVGYIHSRVMSDTQRIGSLVSWTVLESLWQIGYVVGAVVVMFVINARLALLVVAVLPLTVLLFSLFQARLTKANREIRELNSQITGDFNEGITGARTIKTLVIEEKMEKSFVTDTASMRRKSVGAARLRGAFAVTMNFASSLALAIVLWKGGVIAKTQIGTFSMFMSYAQGMMEPVRWIVDAISDLITTQVNIERLTKLLETKPDVNDSAEVMAIYGDSFEPKKERPSSTPTGTRRSWSTSIWTSPSARTWPSWGRPARANPPWPTSSAASTSPPRAGCLSPGGMPGSAASCGCTRPSAMCYRRPISSPAPCGRTCSTAIPRPARRRSTGRWSWFPPRTW